jgi:hypothetical protein
MGSDGRIRGRRANPRWEDASQGSHHVISNDLHLMTSVPIHEVFKVCLRGGSAVSRRHKQNMYEYGATLASVFTFRCRK